MYVGLIREYFAIQVSVAEKRSASKTSGTDPREVHEHPSFSKCVHFCRFKTRDWHGSSSRFDNYRKPKASMKLPKKKLVTQSLERAAFFSPQLTLG